MNTGFYNDINTNFEQACFMSEYNYTHEELINMLKSGNIPEKQIAALRLENINSLEEGHVLLDNLIDCDGKIREAVALKINQLLNNNSNNFKYLNKPDVFAKATIDINSNICRLIIDTVSIIISEQSFSEIYINQILKYIDETFVALDKIIYKDKKYTINKQLFKLYWCLESMKLFADSIDKDILLNILERASLEKEYTIREKVAQIINKPEIAEFTATIRKRLIEDNNYYVREALKGSAK